MTASPFCILTVSSYSAGIVFGILISIISVWFDFDSSPYLLDFRSRFLAILNSFTFLNFPSSRCLNFFLSTLLTWIDEPLSLSLVTMDLYCSLLYSLFSLFPVTKLLSCWDCCSSWFLSLFNQLLPYCYYSRFLMILGFLASVDSISLWQASLEGRSLKSLSWTRPEITQRVPSDLSLPWNLTYTACSSDDFLSMLSLYWCVSCYVSTLLVSSMSGFLNSLTLVSSFEVMFILLYAPSWLNDRWDGDLTLNEHWEDSFPLYLTVRRSKFYLKSSWLLLAPSSISFDLLFYEPAYSFRYDLFKLINPTLTIVLVKFLIPTFLDSSFDIFSWPMRFNILNSFVDFDFCEFMWLKESLLWLLLVFD